ncbi:plasmid partitioning/stability family protein [Yersinia ruckeri]|nr:plasmid partitioning/stability family protein [Yersinia ruckeri]MCW6528018.1 plasmid partitioning/stability family protein [Yersinia ruckeri]MCW6563190.1 plasmid partitioning/stability family protein [Yersinia ruckeri]UZY05128.1 plasmid partitioning/stability family protein [Yersinia ruckeri]
MDDKRKKIIAYLHPSIYPQGILTQQYVESLPTQVRGEFYRQSIICGAALSSIDPRLVNLISVFF